MKFYLKILEKVKFYIINKKYLELFSKELLNNMVNEFVESLNFGKSMRWGSRSDSFIRPIRFFFDNDG